MAFPLTAIVLEYLLRGNILNASQWFGVGILVVSIYRVTNLNASGKHG